MRGPLVLCDGYAILDWIDSMGLLKITEVGADEHNTVVSSGSGWKKKNIFWDLPYWASLRVRHNLDVMHIEKMYSSPFLTFWECQRTI